MYHHQHGIAVGGVCKQQTFALTIWQEKVTVIMMALLYNGQLFLIKGVCIYLVFVLPAIQVVGSVYFR